MAAGGRNPQPRLHETPDEPRVSIIICNYNYARYLDRAIESALEQQHACEVIVVDDGSTDNSRELLKGWSAKGVRVLLQPNGGQRAAYQAGFAESSGQFVLFLDADDFLHVDAIARVLGQFEKGVAKVHFRLQLVDENGVALGPVIPRRVAEGDVGAALLRRGVLYASAPGSGNVYRRSAVEHLFPLPSHATDRHGADFFLIYGCALFGEVRTAPGGALASYRVHQSSLLDGASVVFGNAASKVDPRARFEVRAAQLRSWLAERSASTGRLPERLLDFSQAKATFATRALQDGYLERVRKGSAALPDLFTSLWYAEDFSGLQKLAIGGWAFVVLAAPLPLSRPLARYVTNPASR